MSAPASSAPGLGNVRLISILAASLLAGYAGDEAYNAWWRPSAGESTQAAAQLVEPAAESEIAKVALAKRP
jgi:hypothetical protein